MATQHKAPPARNYGARYEGGDTHAMGAQLNEEMRHAWHRLQNCREWIRLDPKHPAAMNYADMADDSRRVLAVLARIRHAARTGA